MKLEKECAICGGELATASCKMCGVLVGENCLDRIAGICTKCKSGRRT